MTDKKEKETKENQVDDVKEEESKTKGKKRSKVEEPERDIRYESLNTAIEQIHRKFGKGSLMKWGSDAILEVDSISTGSLSLDLALGVKGVPKGRVVEIFGPEASGKTTLALHIIANAQKGGGIAAFIDAEHALDPTYSKQLGVNLDDLHISQPDSGEQALEILDLLVSSNALDVVVVDSVAALVPKAELEGDMGDSHMGLQARLMSQALRKLTGVIKKSNTCVVFINQMREKIGVFFGSPETTTGGRALKFYASVRIDIRRLGSIKKGEEVIGCRTCAKVVKNKVAPPFRSAEFDIYFGKGISWVGDVLDLAIANKVVSKSGAWMSYKDNRWQGRENALEALDQHPDVIKEIEEIILEKVSPTIPSEPEPSESPTTEVS